MAKALIIVEAEQSRQSRRTNYEAGISRPSPRLRGSVLLVASKPKGDQLQPPASHAVVTCVM
jgi:hypothetical protein